MRKRLTLDILGISEIDRATLKKLADEQYGKSSISYLVTQLLSEILRKSSKPIESSHAIREKRRIEIRLSKSERKKLAVLAQSHHMTINAFIASITRKFLNKAPLLTAAEVEALYQSNAQLLRIGRNLNQITKQLNSLEGGSITSGQVKALKSYINSHTEKVGALLQANRRRNDG